MIKLTVMYPNSSDLKFDKDYYLNQHSQLLSELLGNAIIASNVNFGIAGGSPEQAAPYVVIANLSFESMETFQQSFGANAEKILADLPNFTNVKPEVQISEVVQ
ncbi:EthD family reductase [Yeosuana sp.]|uniref:EthD family reductase n=1 Tax=Yeosuana sp. TaxID=2529388 RepID=UPI0040553189|tara:strand:- start:2453 stop:2764 length:312 start_codon:yes stop_codon:yes gene_type:complete